MEDLVQRHGTIGTHLLHTYLRIVHKVFMILTYSTYEQLTPHFILILHSLNVARHVTSILHKKFEKPEIKLDETEHSDQSQLSSDYGLRFFFFPLSFFCCILR